MKPSKSSLPKLREEPSPGGKGALAKKTLRKTDLRREIKHCRDQLARVDSLSVANAVKLRRQGGCSYAPPMDIEALHVRHVALRTAAPSMSASVRESGTNARFIELIHPPTPPEKASLTKIRIALSKKRC